MLIKLGEATTDGSNLHIVNPEDALNNQQISERFARLVDKLKQINASGGPAIAPFKSEDFLYFRTAIMHAAEKANLDKNGNLVGDGKFVIDKTADGKDVWKWSSASGVHPYTNSNGDLFPEEELIKAAPTWIGKGLYCNHQSSDVEKLRGIIIDTQYDTATKALWGLVALDRKNFPILASQVKNGTIRNVSMGTAVKHSFCTVCGNEAIVEADYCPHIKNKLKNKFIDAEDGRKILVGEINVGLTGVELSLVSIPADSEATIRHVYASLESQLREARKELEDNKTDNGITTASLDEIKETLDAVKVKIDKIGKDNYDKIIGGTSMDKIRKERAANRRKSLIAYYQGTFEPKPGQVNFEPESMNKDLRDNFELGKARKEEAETAPKMGDKGTDQKVREEQQRVVAERKAKREKIRRAYMQGTLEPTPPVTFTPDTTERDLRRKDVEKFTSEARETGVSSTGLAGGDLPVKEKLQRAHYLGAKFTYAKNKNGDINKPNSYWTVYATKEVDTPFDESNKLFSVTAGQAYGPELNKIARDDNGDEDKYGRTNWNFISSKEYGNELIEFIKARGVDRVVETFKTAAGMTGEMPGPDEGVVGGERNINPPEGGEAPFGGNIGEDEKFDELSEGPEESPEEPTDDKERVKKVEKAYDELGDAIKKLIGKEDITDEDKNRLDDVMGAVEETPKALTDEHASREAKLKAIENLSKTSYEKVVSFLKYAKSSLEEEQEAEEEEDKKKDDEEDETEDKKVDKKENKKGKKKDDEEDDEEEDKEEDNKKGKKKSSDKTASPTGHEVKDIAAPANAGRKITSPTGNEPKDVPEIISPYISDSYQSDNVGGQDMNVESVREQHDKDMAAATSNPTGADIDGQKSASSEFAGKVGEVITASALEEAKNLAVAKMKVSFELASEMADKGLISEDSIQDKANEFYNMSEAAFDSVKRVVSGLASVKNDTVKTASAIASLGNVNGDRTLPAEDNTEPKTLADRLSDSRFGWH